MALASFREELQTHAQAIAAPGKGILAADESTGTIGKRFQEIGIANTEETRRAFRGLLATTPGLGAFISGVILYEETLFQDHADGTAMIEKFRQQGILPGIKVDKGVQPLAGGLAGETWCTGLEGLQERAARYYARGARFAKWRAVFRITPEGSPSELCLRENAWGLARYARTMQEEGLVPIVEPEILMDGEHDIGTTADVQERVLRTVYEALAGNGVFLEGSLLKPSMTTCGTDCSSLPTAAEVAAMTVRTLERTVPAAVPGIFFLSGGLSEEDASLFLDAINRHRGKAPWRLAFSFGRALQHSCLKHWNGNDTEAGQAALSARAQANSEASMGRYVPGSQPSDDASLFVAGYSY